jgi:hypothetical protein
MGMRGLYRGPVDGRVNDELKRVVMAYKLALGMPEDLEIDEKFFRGYLSADHAKAVVIARTRLAETAPTEPPQASRDRDVVPAVQIMARRGANAVYARGEPVELDIVAERDSSLYCYLIEADGKAQQFFPNRAQANPKVAAGTRLEIPGTFPFRLLASVTGKTETVACFASAKDIGARPLPAAITVRDASELERAFAAVDNQNEFWMGNYDVVTK